MFMCACVYVCVRSEEHTSELQSHLNLVCRLLLEKTDCNPEAAPPERAPSEDDARFSVRRAREEHLGGADAVLCATDCNPQGATPTAFFKRYVANGDLPSFPTRRFSD